MAAILEKNGRHRLVLYYILYINNSSKWIPRPKKPGYSHQNHNCISSSIGRDMVKIGWNGSHFEKHGCHVSYITYLSQTNSCSNLFSGPENLGIAPRQVILWTFWVEIGLNQELVGLYWPFWRKKQNGRHVRFGACLCVNYCSTGFLNP